MSEAPLGRSVDFPQCYSPQVLAPIERRANREALGLDPDQLPFAGADLWNVYELSWLDPAGKPRVALARLLFPCTLPKLVESKSMKLYLGSFNQEHYRDGRALASLIQHDLSAVAGGEMSVVIRELDEYLRQLPESPAGECLDALALKTAIYEPEASLLVRAADAVVDEVLYTDLFRSRCPVTGQPDWATVTVCYRGAKISREGLLAYLVSYRQHYDYHENCVERIFQDIKARCAPAALTVEANFLRRGGIDINPVRSTSAIADFDGFPRHLRQ